MKLKLPFFFALTVLTSWNCMSQNAARQLAERLLGNDAQRFEFAVTKANASDSLHNDFFCLSQDNRLLREAGQRFFVPPARAKVILRRSCHQQGLLDIYQNFCQALDCDCGQCPFSSEGGAAGDGEMVV